MWKPIYQPEPWPQFVKRKDIIALPLMEQRKKFMQETILFENYLSTLNTVNTVNSSVASSAAAGGGGPLPGGGGTPTPTPVIPGWKATIDLRQQFPTSEWGTNNSAVTPTTAVVGFGTGISTTAPRITPISLSIDWGDGNTIDYTNTNYRLTADFASNYMLAITHSYGIAGPYTITVSGPSALDAKLGALPIANVDRYEINNEYPSFTGFPSLAGTFNGANWEGYFPASGKDIANWDVSSVIDFSQTFQGFNYFAAGIFESSSFSAPIPNLENWDVSSALTLAYMFMGQNGTGNQDWGTWDTSNVTSFNHTFNGAQNLISGGRADLWDISGLDGSPWYNTVWGMFDGSMTDASVRGSMPHIGNWDTVGVFGGGGSNHFFNTFKNSGFSHTAVGQTLIGWASQSLVPSNISLASSAFSNTWDGSGFSNPTYSTGSAFGAEVKATYDHLTGASSDGSTTTFTVTTAIGKGDQERYRVNGYSLENPDLIDDFTFLIGNTYRFDQSDASNAGHPLKFSTTIDGTHGGGVEYTTGVTIVGTPGTAGAYSEITVTENTASPLYVYCPNHAGYGLGYSGTTPKPLTMNEGGKGWTIPGFTFN